MARMLPITLRGAETHNLKHVDLELVPGQVVALTGPSGSGKSSLALDTLYAEGQRRFVESFSPYARQFLERMERPPVERLDPVAATVAVDRRAPIKSSRSTLCTMTDLEPYLSALFAAEATPLCPSCQEPARLISARTAAEELGKSQLGRTVLVAFPLQKNGAEDDDIFALPEAVAKLVADGFARVLIRDPKALAGAARVERLDALTLPLHPGERLYPIADRLTISKKTGDAARLEEALATCFARGGEAEVVVVPSDAELADASRVTRLRFAPGLICPSCLRSFEPPHERLFSYNSPLGACPACRGFGRVIDINWDKVLPDPSLSLADGAIRPWSGKSSEWERATLKSFAKRHKIPLDRPWEELTKTQQRLVLDGEGTWDDGSYPGVRAWFKYLETKTYKMHVRVLLSRYRAYVECAVCKGARLSPQALSYQVAGKHLAEWHALAVSDAARGVAALVPRSPQGLRVQAELKSRLGYLVEVGLGYLTLDRQARTLSGGEAQRAALTTALGAGLTGTLFVLDEPSVGLHASDVPRLGAAVTALGRAGNSVLLIEHDAALIRACDRAVELGPQAGKNGGRILYDGPPSGLYTRPELPSGAAALSRHETRRTPRTSAKKLRITGIELYNLRELDVEIPLGVVCAVTGPSGSGKSSLVEEIIYRAVARRCGDKTVDKPGPHRALFGAEALRDAVLVDQSPLGRTARGNPATYTKAWDRLRARFADESEARQRGLTASHFSFNLGAGRCEACAGEGYETVEMQFLADVSFLCPVCQGRRFKPEVLAVRHAGLSVAETLELSVEEALRRFAPPSAPDPALTRALQPVIEVGLGYLPLGQPLSTLSGGEAQRLKLARALSQPAKDTLFVIDEPSAGLHPIDVRPVVRALHHLVDAGASVVVVEHDLSVVAAADWVLDLGPGGGPEGGRLVAAGTPETIAASETRTGEALRVYLGLGPATVAATTTETRLPVLPAAITVEHAREHNLRAVSCQIPHGTLAVVTGPSGSGKSSLAFDVIYAEGQRRFVETLSPYARQFLPTLPRPDVDHVAGVPPSIALEQRTARAGVNSTVATVTEVAHYLRLLYAKVGTPHCPSCGQAVTATAPEALFARLTALADGEYTVYAPAVRGRKGLHQEVLEEAVRAGIAVARIDGKLVYLDPPPKLVKAQEHSIDLVVYTGALPSLPRARFEQALHLGGLSVRVAKGPPRARPSADERDYSTARTCAACGLGIPELDPRWFSFNTKQGQCEKCQGRGYLGDDDDAPSGPPCRACGGTRLSPIPRAVRLHDRPYVELMAQPVSRALSWVRELRFAGSEALIADAPWKELLRRLEFIEQVGLGYLGLDRAAATLSGGELQRLRLSAQLGSGLTGALYVLDEPTIGLHPRDTDRLIKNLQALTRTGSTVLVVEHDEETIRAADYLLDLGPSGGRGGGRIVAAGPVAEVLREPDSPTARALSAEPVPAHGQRAVEAGTPVLSLRGVNAHNLRGVDVKVPLGRLVVVAGPSGSGKSTLLQRVLYPALRKELGLVTSPPLPYKRLDGAEQVRRALLVDQSPIGRTPRSVPATFLGIFDEIRRLYAGLPEAKIRGYTTQRFSFNTKAGGRCEVCEGQGAIVSEMSFLPDVVTACEACGGARFTPSTLEVRYRGLDIGQVLRLSAEEAAAHFQNHPKIARPLEILCDLGVGYLQLGQGSHTLSGGEAQRLKLAAELCAGARHEATVYVLDEPTTGLHLLDVRRLVAVLGRLVERGDTVIAIEHHLDVIAAADWVLELGPGAGEEGGRIVFEGPPEALVRADTATGRCLLSRSRPREKPGRGRATAKESPSLRTGDDAR